MLAEEIGSMRRYAAVGRSGWPADQRPGLCYYPVMSYATRRCVLLGLHQPMQSLSGGKRDAVSVTLSTVNRFRRLLPV